MLLLASLYVSTNINSDIFFSWTTKCLLPKAPKHSVFVLDNASFHKRLDIIDAIEKAGHIVLFLPPYSPDLNPIEKTWAHLKSDRRKTEKTVELLFHERLQNDIKLL